jgi:hypothetical protein
MDRAGPKRSPAQSKRGFLAGLVNGSPIGTRNLRAVEDMVAGRED